MIFIIVVSAGTSGVAMEETTPSTSRSESADVSLARRTLFDCADGCVGVLKRQHPTEKTMEADEDVCQECKKETPPKRGRAKRSHSDDVSWVGCDKCQRWFHVLCTDLKATPRKKDIWKCKSCT